jgi:type VI secretion system secreted protein Hcp
VAVDIFLELDGIKGEAQNPDFKDQIDILSWSWGASNTGTTHMGSGGTAGRVNVQDISFQKYCDKASHALLLACCNGKHIPKGKLTARKAGGDSAVDYLVIEFEDLIISGFQTGGSGSDERQVESVTANFRSFKYKYTPQKADGTADSTMEVGWNIAENKKV